MYWKNLIYFVLGLIALVGAYPQASTENSSRISIENEHISNSSQRENIKKERKDYVDTMLFEKEKLSTKEITVAPIDLQIEIPPTMATILVVPTHSSIEGIEIDSTQISTLSPHQSIPLTPTVSSQRNSFTLASLTTAKPLSISPSLSPPATPPLSNSSSLLPAEVMKKENQPSCIKGNSVYCEQLEDSEINKMIKVIQHLNMTDTYFTENPKELAQRRNDPVEDALCHTVERYIYPQSAKNRENEWRYIVNNGRFTQAVRVEECTLVGSPCQLSPKFPATYQSECRQKYIYHNLLGYDSDGKAVKDFYKLPSCCQCFVKPRK